MPAKVASTTAHTDELPEGRESKKVRRFSFERMMTQPMEGTTDEEARLMGARPKPEVQKQIDAILRSEKVEGLPYCHLMPTPMGRFTQMTKEFPLHFAKTFMSCFIPMLAGCVPAVMIGLRYKMLADEFPDFVGTGSHLGTYRQHKFSSGLMAFSLIDRAFCMTSYYAVGICLFCTVWSPKVMFKPLLLKGFLPFYTFHVIMQFTNRIGMANSESCFFLNDYLFIIQGLCILGAAITIGKIAQGITKQPAFAAMFGFLMFVIILIVIIYDYVLWWNLIQAPDMTKLIMGAIVNPLLFECFLLFFARSIARTIPYGHESTLSCPCALVMAIKKMIGRFIINLIKDPMMVLAASIILGVFEILSVTTLAVRDRAMYNMCCRGAAAQGHDPLAAMKKARLLRVRNAHTETVLEMLFTILSSLVVFGVWDISLDQSDQFESPTGRLKSAAADAMIIGIVIQIVCEIAVDYLSCAWLTVMCKQPMLAVTHLNYEGYTLFMCFLMFFGGVFMCDNVVTAVIANSAQPQQQATWILYPGKDIMAGFNVSITDENC